ncbi:LysR family transcriptional regulator [Chromatiaceae bacterium AAb-1]|jgi:DNA-binding transcriptional LysR family regulator|nr:LysR family transcriptional regulator [Chromatiaceae bacterium AAb-1]
MKTVTPNDLMVFVLIAKHKSFTRAAAELAVSPSAVSYSMRMLEERLNVRLFNRTTRSVSLTDAGEKLLKRVQPAFRDIDDALEDLSYFSGRPYGALRINSGLPSAQMVLLPIVAGFMVANPEVTIEIGANDALVDMVSQGFDAGVRFGEHLAQDMIATAISRPLRSAVVATPAFFEQHGIPAHPEQLQGLPMIAQRFPSSSIYKWDFEKGGTELLVSPEGHLTLSDMRLAVDAALLGSGLAFVFEKMVEADIAAGRLQRVLEDWCPYYPGLFLYYPSRRQVPYALKCFIDFAREGMRAS